MCGRGLLEQLETVEAPFSVRNGQNLGALGDDGGGFSKGDDTSCVDKLADRDKSRISKGWDPQARGQQN